VKLYDELAEWWPLFSAPEDYAEEAAFFARLLTDSCDPRRAPFSSLDLVAATTRSISSEVSK
jgi:hypothetical protein